ncbi:MAG: hypothetical protein JWR50_4266 [Mucilaginibacter sp.]|nr:hypothetical protein [Mucilaginibacter sp.]
MKTLLKIMLLPISLWAACTNTKTTNFIPGTYVNHAESAYSIADDTLVITAAPQNPNSYQVTRKTAFSRKVANQLQPPEHKLKSFMTIWDADKQSLQLTQNGTVILFQPDNNTLRVENSEYRKIN